MLLFTTKLIAITAMLFIITLLLLSSSLGSFALAANTTSNSNTTASVTSSTTEIISTTVTPTTTATVAGPSGLVYLKFPSAIYVNQTIRASITISQQPSSRLDVMCWVQPQPFELAVSPINSSFFGMINSSASGNMTMANVTAMSIPDKMKTYMVYFDMSLQGPSASEFLISSSSSPATTTTNSSSTATTMMAPASSKLITIQIRALETISISPISSETGGTTTSSPTSITSLQVGQTLHLQVNLSALPPSDVDGSELIITPHLANLRQQEVTISRQQMTYTPTSSSTVMNVTLTAISSTAVSGDITLSWTVGGSLAFAYSRYIPSMSIRVVNQQSSTTMMNANTTSSAVISSTTIPMTTAPSSPATSSSSSSGNQTTSSSPASVDPSATATSSPTQQTSSSSPPSPPTTTEVSINPSSPPPGWLVVKMKNNSALTTQQKDNMRNKLAIWLGYPSNQISVGQPNAAGDVLVLLLAPEAGSNEALNETAVNEALAKATTLSTTQLSQLGAASIIEGTLAPPTPPPSGSDEPERDVGVIIGCAAAGLVVLLIAVVVSRKFSNNNNGTDGSGRHVYPTQFHQSTSSLPTGTGNNASGHNVHSDRPFTHMEKEMAVHKEHQQQFPQATVHHPDGGSSVGYVPPPVQTPADAPVMSQKRAYPDIDDEL